SSRFIASPRSQSALHSSAAARASNARQSSSEHTNDRAPRRGAVGACAGGGGLDLGDGGELTGCMGSTALMDRRRAPELLTEGGGKASGLGPRASSFVG